MKFPSTTEMLKDIMNNINSCFQNIQIHQTILRKEKAEFVLNGNHGEDERTKTMDSTEIALHERDDTNVSSEKKASRNLYAVINHLQKLNSVLDRGLGEVEECIQNIHKVLMKNLLS